MNKSTERNWFFWLGLLCLVAIQMFAIVFVANEYRNKTNTHHKLLSQESKLSEQVRQYQLEFGFLSALSKVDKWAKKNEMIVTPDIKKQKIFSIPHDQKSREN